MDDLRHFRCPSCGGVNRLPAARLSEHPKCGRCQAALDLSGAPQHLDDDQAERLIQQSPVPVLVDFYADWCGPCRALVPALQQLGRQHAGRLMVIKIDTDHDQRLASGLGVRGIPALHLYKGGRPVDSVTGARPLAELQRWLSPHLSA